MFKLLIVEDNISVSLDLEMMAQDMGHQVLATVDNSVDALDAIFDQSPDLVLMDIDIKGKLNGIELGNKIKYLDIPIVFITGHTETAFFNEAKQTNIAGYLVKPPNPFTLQTTIQMAMKNRHANDGPPPAQQPLNMATEGHILIKKNKLYYYLDLNEVQFIEAFGNYSIFHTSSKKHLSNTSFGKLEASLPPALFIKTHRSYLLNMNHFAGINLDDNVILLKSGTELPVSRAHKQGLLERLKPS